MELPNYPVDINIQLGDESNQYLQQLLRASVRNHGPGQVGELKARAKLTEDVGDDIIVMFKYSVHEGREEEAEKYFWAALNQQLEKSVMTPLQYITRRPDEEDGVVNVHTEPGTLVVTYRFLSQNFDEEFKQGLLTQVGKFHTLNFDVALKGFVSHTMKNRQNVKVEQAKLRMYAEEADSEILQGVMLENEMIPQEVITNPIYSAFSRVKKVHFSLKFKGFRQMYRHYESVMKKLDHDFGKENREDFKYTNAGFFREKVECFLFYANQFGVSGEVTLHGEDVFMRLVKVYFKALRHMADDW